MNRWGRVGPVGPVGPLGIILLAAMAMSAPLSVAGQTRGSAGSRPGPAARPRPHGSPSQPSSVTGPPFAPFPPFPMFPPGATRVPTHGLTTVRLFGFGLMCVDPYWWATAPLPPGDTGPTGGLQLDVEPWRARVYVDGWFVGVVDEFSGYYHHLDLAAGAHRIELEADDYDPLIVDVVISPGRTATYRASMTEAHH
jgi:hypothetical protein